MNERFAPILPWAEWKTNFLRNAYAQVSTNAAGRRIIFPGQSYSVVLNWMADGASCDKQMNNYRGESHPQGWSFETQRRPMAWAFFYQWQVFTFFNLQELILWFCRFWRLEQPFIFMNMHILLCTSLPMKHTSKGWVSSLSHSRRPEHTFFKYKSTHPAM